MTASTAHPPTHDQQTTAQFGPQASAYLSSAVHAQGQDLADIAAALHGQRDAQVLDIGCGAGHLAFAIAPEVGRVTACDLSDDMLRVTAEAAAARGLSNVDVKRASAEALPFADASVDVVCTRFSAHHWPQLARALSEARRVLKPRGRLFVIDTIAPDDALQDTYLQAVELLRDTSHVRNRTVAQWHTELKQAGFVLRGHRRWPLRMEFASWVARMRTPADRVAVIRGLLSQAPAEVKAGLAIAEDGSFDLEAAWFEAQVD